MPEENCPKCGTIAHEGWKQVNSKGEYNGHLTQKRTDEKKWFGLLRKWHYLYTCPKCSEQFSVDHWSLSSDD
jgi:hypothetical protein